MNEVRERVCCKLNQQNKDDCFLDIEIFFWILKFFEIIGGAKIIFACILNHVKNVQFYFVALAIFGVFTLMKTSDTHSV